MDSRAGSQPTTARRGVPSEVGGDERLDFHEHRARALHARQHGGARSGTVAAGEEQGGRVHDLAEAGAGHFEHADLVGGAEAVLHRAQDAELAPALALEGHDGVDHVLDDARAGDLPVLGDVADHDHAGAGGLGVADERLRRHAHLRHGAGRSVRRAGPHGLDGIR